MEGLRRLHRKVLTENETSHSCGSLESVKLQAAFYVSDFFMMTCTAPMASWSHWWIQPGLPHSESTTSKRGNRSDLPPISQPLSIINLIFQMPTYQGML
jgi:hypothetical protein